MPNTEYKLKVTDVGEFIRHKSCERRFKLEYANKKEARLLPFFDRLFNPLDPVLQEVGNAREDEWEQSLRDGWGFADLSRYGERVSEFKRLRAAGENPHVDTKTTTWLEFVEAVSGLAANQEAYAREVKLHGEVGAFQVEGRIDFVILRWRDGKPYLRLVECKASRKDRTYHRLQVGLYRLLVEQLLKAVPLEVAGYSIAPESIECVVVRIDQSTNESQSMIDTEPLELSVITSDVERLLAAEGKLVRIINTDLDNISYKLETKCDSCVFNTNCFPESARQRKLEILGLSPSSIRVLQSNGVEKIDELAELDTAGVAAIAIRQSPGFAENLELLKAKAIARRRMLPNLGEPLKDYAVSYLPDRWQSQLPLHVQDGQALIRIFLSVDYDYTENRIGALSAHVSRSSGMLYTPIVKDGEYWSRSPEVIERVLVGKDQDGKAVYSEQPLQGKEVIKIKPHAWSGYAREDAAVEKDFIRDFFLELVGAIGDVAEGAERAPIHFYVWSRSEISQLIEGCTRAGSELLTPLRELLGCRDSLEQLIFSCLQTEVDNRFALGWTGRGLAVVTSLNWFGWSYHWRRKVRGRPVYLDRAFTQDIFDFKTDLYIDGAGKWSTPRGRGASRHKFEIRSRFHDSLPAPYWHALWRKLPEADNPSTPRNVKNALRRYQETSKPNYLREYLRARVHALRWVEERIDRKNKEIRKPPVIVDQLPNFSLNVNNVSQSAVDFLRLEQHVKFTDWAASIVTSPLARLSTGKTIPISNARAFKVAKEGIYIDADIDLTGYDFPIDELEARCRFAVEDFVRVTVHNGDPDKGQTLGQMLHYGSTCVVEDIDWHARKIRLSVIPMKSPDRYRLKSFTPKDGTIAFSHATVDESPSDYVAVRVDARLDGTSGNPMYRWFDPISPRVPEQIPLSPITSSTLQAIASRVDVGGGMTLNKSQVTAVIEGLDTRVQLLLGPPGTGKTMTTAVATLIRTLARFNRPGEIILVAANTHTAVDNLLERIVRVLPSIKALAEEHGLGTASITVAKVLSDKSKTLSVAGVVPLRADACANAIKAHRKDSVLIIGSTTGTLLKMAENLNGTSAFPLGFSASALIVDEGSMMVFPHFLSLATLVQQSGEVMVAGDHRQLSPILSHDWKREDRPPAVLYHPFVSAYDAVRDIAEQSFIRHEAVRQSALTYTFRLPPMIRSLIGTLYKKKDKIALLGPMAATSDFNAPSTKDPWAAVWNGETGLYLVVHDENQSRQGNFTEIEIIQNLLAANDSLPDKSVAVITPHRAQKNLLSSRLAQFRPAVDLINTVESLQGGERPTVFYSATVSDPSAISANVDFILNLNRSNVAFSRPIRRLIVVCSEELINHIPVELENYEDTLLWKSIRSLCSREVARMDVSGSTVRVLMPTAKDIADALAESGV